MKNLILFGSILMLLACNHSPQIAASAGKPTTFKSNKHGEDFRIKSIHIKVDKIEVNFNTTEYHIYPNNFKQLSIGSKYHFDYQWGPWVVDAGVGFQLTETDRMNKWLAKSPILADVSLATGIRKDFGDYQLELLYMLRHLSVPWRDDRGLNYDAVQFGVSIPW